MKAHATLVIFAFVLLFGDAFASDLTVGKKAMFSEDFELDVYEWRMEEEGATEEELPQLIRTDLADEGHNALALRGKRGILALDLVTEIKGIVEFRVRFDPPFDYTRMFAVGLDDEEVLLGLNGSGTFTLVAKDGWKLTPMEAGGGWHTFTYDLSGVFARIYIDGRKVAELEHLRELNRVRLGINHGKGGNCLVDAFVIYSAEAGIAEDEAVEVEIPLLGWDDGFKSCRAASETPEPGRLGMTDAVARTGRHSLEVEFGPYPSGGGRGFNFHRRMPLPGVPQKIGLWVRGDGSGSEIGLGFDTPNSHLKYRIPKVTWTGWKKVEIDLTRECDQLYGREWALKEAAHEGASIVQFVIPNQPAGAKGHVYLDDLTVTTRLSRHAPYVLYAENTAEDNIVELGDPAEFILRVGNYGEQDAMFTIDYQLRDYEGRTVHNASTSIEVPAGQNAHARLQVDDLFNGWYQALFILTRDGRTLMTEEESIAVLAPLDPVVFSDANPLGNYSGPSRVLPRIGMAECYVNNPPSPKELAFLEEHNFTGIVFYQAPKWAYLPDEEMHVAAEAWAEEIAETSASLKGKPIYYKVLTEPNNSGISPPRCYEVIKYAHRGLTKGDPEAKIIGLNTSKFDWGRQKVVWGLGGVRYIHAAGVHPYVGAHMGGIRPERVHGIGNLMSMLRLDDMLRRHNQGRPKKIWASEFGMTSSLTDPNEGSYERQADLTARTVIVFKTMENFGKIHYHLPRDSSVWGKFGLFTVTGEPKPAAAAFHTLARRLTGVKWLKTIEAENNVRAYLFETPEAGRQMIAAWAIEGGEAFSLPVACEAVEVMNLMGGVRMEACADGRLKLGLTESPVFVSSVGGTRLVDQWVQVERRYRELRTGSVQTPYVVRVANLGSELLAGTLTCDPPDGITAAEAKQGFEVPPGETRNFTVAIDVAADCEPGLRDLVFALESHPLYSSRSMISVVRPETALAPARVAEAPVIDGKLDEEAWQDAKAFTPFLDDTTGFVPLVNQEVRLVYDAKGLYVGMTCRTRAGEALRADHQERDDPLLWQDECVELFLDPDLDRNNYYQFIVNVEGVEGDRKYVDTKTQKPDWEGAGDWDGSMTSATSRTEDRWAVEIHIPWEDVEVEPGRVHRMGINLCRKYAPVGDATIRSYTPSGIQVHGVESYPVVEVDLR